MFKNPEKVQEIFSSIPDKTIDKSDVLNLFTYVSGENEQVNKHCFERALMTASKLNFASYVYTHSEDVFNNFMSCLVAYQS